MIWTEGFKLNKMEKYAIILWHFTEKFVFFKLNQRFIIVILLEPHVLFCV